MSQLAFNPETKQYLMLQNGKWTPAQVAQDAAGRKVYLDENGWQPLDAAGEVAAPAGMKPKTPGEMSWGEVARRGIGNLPSSGWRLLTDTASALVTPETYANLAKTAYGGAQKARRKMFGGERGDYEQYADAIAQYYKDRYGSEKGWKTALAEDPAGVLADLSTVFSGGAGAAKLGGLLGKAAAAGSNAAHLAPVAKAFGGLEKGAGAVGQGLSRAAALTDPFAAVAYPVGWGAHWAGAPEALYRNALKTNIGFGGKKPLYSPEEINAVVERGMATRTPVSAGGMEATQKRIAEMSKKLDSAIEAADAKGITLDPLEIADNAMQSGEVAPYLEAVGKGKAKRQIENAMSDFLDDFPDPMPLSQAQAVKKNTYQILDPAYNNNARNLPGTTVSSKKALASELRKGIARELDAAAARGDIPEKLDGVPVNEFNRRIGTDIDLRDMTERSLAKAGNRSPISMTAAMAGTLATGAAPSGSLAGLAWQWLKHPSRLSRGAFLLDDLRSMGNPLRPYLAGARADDVNDRSQKAYNIQPRGLLQRWAER